MSRIGIMLMAFLLVVWGAVWVIGRDRGGRVEHVPTKDSPTEALQRRYAAGEFSTEDYEGRNRKANE